MNIFKNIVILASCLLLSSCSLPIKKNFGWIHCYDPETWDAVYNGPFVGAVALDTRGKGSVLFRSSDEELAQIIIGANCLIHYSYE